MFKLTKNRVILFAGAPIFAVMAVLMLAACDVGLGMRVNTDRPIIGMPEDEGAAAPGAFLFGNSNTIILDIEQPFGIDEVFMDISFTDLDGNPQTARVPAVKNADGLYEVNIDTVALNMRDGEFRATVTAIDRGGNTTTTTDMIYFVKNTPPQIELSIPRLRGEQFDSHNLTQDLAENKIYVGTDLMGTAFDAKGIAIGYPKVMIWPAEGNDFYGEPNIDSVTKLPVKINPNTGLPSELEGDHLDEKWGKWHTVVDSMYRPLNMNPLDNITAMQFRWPLVELHNDGTLKSESHAMLDSLKPGSYNVMIITKDSFANPNYNYYPNRVENPNYTPAENPIKFMTIGITAATNPIVRIRETPSYHNPNKEFAGIITVEMPIPGMTLQGISARFSDIDNTSLIRLEDLAGVFGGSSDITIETATNLSNGEPLAGNGYRITMTPEKVKSDIQSGNFSGTKYWLIKVEGGDEQTAETRQPVVFDSTPPYINFIQPQGMKHETTPNTGPTVTSTVTIRGSTLDNQIVHSMYYVLGHTETARIATLGTDAENENFTGWINTGLGDNDCISSCLPNCAIHLPITNHPGNGIDLLPSGLPIRSSWMKDPNIIGILPAWTWVFDDIYDFCVGLPGSIPENAVAGTVANYYVTVNNRGRELWNLPIWFKIVDMAGNVRVVKSNLILDPNADMPETIINTPANGAVVGGQVRVTGLANDNEYIHTMEMRVRMIKGSDNRTKEGWYIGGPDSDANGGFVAINEPRGSVGTRGSTVSWFLNLNTESNEPLTPKNPDNTFASGVLQEVEVEIRARDSYISDTHNMKPIPGYSEKITLWFSPDVPRIGDPTIIKGTWDEYLAADAQNKALMTEAYAFGENKVAKNIVIITKLTTSSDLTSIRVNMNGAWTEYIQRTNPVDFNLPWIVRNSPAGQTQNNEYTLYIPVDTNDVNAGQNSYLPTGTPNILQIGVDCTDNSDGKFKGNYVIQLQADNFYPMAVYEGYLTANGNFEIMGRAWDSAVGKTRVQNVERVVVFFARDDNTAAAGQPTNASNNGMGRFVYLNNGALATDGVDFRQSAFHVRRDRTGTVPTAETQSTVTLEGTTPAHLIRFPIGLETVNFDDKGRRIWLSNNNGIVIDENSLDVAGSGTGFSGGSVKNWSVIYDSTKLPDGKYILHYVIFDHAMNATHYQTNIYVANNRPLIKTVSLGTDNDSNGSVGSDELMLFPAVTSPDPIGYRENQPYFRVINQRFRLDINAEKGNGLKRFRVYYATRNAATALQAGKVYTINVPGAFEWFNYGAPEAHANAAGYAGVTFMATKTVSLTGGASAWQYSDGTGSTLATGNFTGNAVTNAINFTTGFPEDSLNVRIDDNTGKIEWDRDGTAARYYLIHVYDNTVGTFADTDAHRADQLSHVALINIGITNGDSLNPRLEVLPIGQLYDLADETVSNPFPTFRNYLDRVARDLPETAAGYNQNVVTDTSGKRMGYVQYRKHAAGTARADISGMVIFKGKAMDNNSIRRITATIPGYNSNNPFDIATWHDNQLVPGSTANGTTGYTMANMKNGTNPWGFEVTDTSSTGEYGNVLNWNFAWDSSLHSNLVASNVTITFTVYDAAGLASELGKSPNVTSNFDIVPYISEIKTVLSNAFRANPSAFNRSATGWYPVRENEVIEIKGFNFHEGDRTTVHIGGTVANNSLTLEAGGGTTGLPARSKTNINANIGTLSSGALRVRVSNGAGTPVWYEAINNSNNTSAHYNKEPNNLNNNNLTDDRNLYVWRVGPFMGSTTATASAEFPFLNPVMRMDPASNWYMAFGGSTTSQGELWATKNGTGAWTASTADANGTANWVFSAQNRWRHTTVAYDSNGWIYTVAADQTAGSTGYRFGHRNPGNTGNGTWARTAVATLDAAGGDRFQIPRIATQTTGTTGTNNPVRILLSYYDSLTPATNALRLRVGLTTGATTTATFGTTNTTGANHVIANNSQTHQGSQFTAVGFLNTTGSAMSASNAGRPVIAWYDRTNQNLVMSYGDLPSSYTNVPQTPTTADWQSRARVVHALAGSHVDMVVDAENTIHLAYYDSLNGGLFYCRIPVPSGQSIPASNATRFTAAEYVKVDTYLSAGTRIMLNVRQETHGTETRYVPYISYFHASFDETKNSIRVAWRKDFSSLKAGSDENDRLTGAWEVMTVPAINTPASGQIISSGVPTSGTPSGTATAGFHNSLTKTMIVGYLTDTNYEGAMLRADMY
ncbi:MAG: hypothetical protein FWC01_00055 [Treponema sp.]|nr:hypothetical protein [Treponema sp.]MCL2236687.1 hypothetical protein [Treponema sp.]